MTAARTSFAVMLAATATVLMLEAMRVFVAYLVFVVDQSRRLELGAIALGVFAAIGLAGILRRTAGWRLTVGTTSIGLAAARIALQFWQSPEARIVLGALVIVCWGWLLTLLLQSLRDAAALGVLLGLALDVAIRIGFGTVDLPWMPGAAANALTVVLVSILSASALMVTRLDEPPIGNAPALSLIAVGPGLAVFHLLTGNLGIAQSTLDIDFPVAAEMIAIGTVLGLLLSALAAAPPSTDAMRDWLRMPEMEGPLALIILTAFGTTFFWFFWQRPGLTGLGLVFGVASSFVLLALALLGSEPGRHSVGGGVAGWFTVGLLLQVVLLFAYYTLTGPPTIIVVAWVLLLAGAFANGARATVNPAWQFSSLRIWFTVTTALLLFVSVRQELEWSQPNIGNPLAGDVTVMTYNIQSGFALDTTFDLERTAQTIERDDPDIVILQEVSRGWLVTSGIDEVLWLSQRLDMRFSFGAASDDGLWGNAILTNAPVSDEMRLKYTSSENFKRAALGVAVETESGPLWVYSTHLDNPDDAGEVRLEQVEQLLSLWNERTPAVIAGDFNADPDSDVVQRMIEAGFDDAGDRPGGATTSKDGRRIDYIFTTAGLDVADIHVGDRWTSDHLPVTARMTLSE